MELNRSDQFPLVVFNSNLPLKNSENDASQYEHMYVGMYNTLCTPMFGVIIFRIVHQHHTTRTNRIGSAGRPERVAGWRPERDAGAEHDGQIGEGRSA